MAKSYNVPSGQAYGDIFLVQTPVLDRWGQQLYAEQKIAEQRRAQENQGLDAMIQKEVGKVRSVDTPDVIKAYQDYKGLKQKLLFDKEAKDALLLQQYQLSTELDKRDQPLLIPLDIDYIHQLNFEEFEIQMFLYNPIECLPLIFVWIQ